MSMYMRLVCRHLASALRCDQGSLSAVCAALAAPKHRMFCSGSKLHSAASRSCSLQPLCSSSLQQKPLCAAANSTTCRRSSSSLGVQHTTWPSASSLHVSSVRSRRPLLLPLQAAAGGGSTGGSGGSKVGYSSSGGSGSGGDSSSGGLWDAYNRLLQQYPLLVKAVTTALLSAVGNLVCQLVVEGKGELDWRRFSTFTALGFVWVAPCLHFWFGTLNRLVPNPGTAGALMRMALDQLGFAPLFISSMIGILAGLDGKDLEGCVGVVRRDLPDAIKANWALWVPAQFINFRFVPASYQVLFANMVALLWNVYFSFATRPKAA